MSRPQPAQRHSQSSSCRRLMPRHRGHRATPGKRGARSHRVPRQLGRSRYRGYGGDTNPNAPDIACSTTHEQQRLDT